MRLRGEILGAMDFHNVADNLRESIAPSISPRRRIPCSNMTWDRRDGYTEV